MKIKSLTVTNFKSLKNVSIDNFLDINMVYGYNNSGKSNLFKFLELVFSSRETRETVQVESQSDLSETRIVKENFWEKTILNHPFIFRQEGNKRLDIVFDITIEIPIEYLKSNHDEFATLKSSLFPDEEESVAVRVVGEILWISPYQAQQKLREGFVNDKRIYFVEDGTEVIFSGIDALNFRDFQGLFGLLNNCVLLLDNDRYFINEDEKATNDDLTSKNFKNKMFDLSLAYISETDFNKLNDFLSQYVTSSTDAVFLNNEKSSPFKKFKFEFVRMKGEIEIFLQNEFGKFPLSSYGTGIQQIIFILSKIFLAGRKIVLIEEIELNLSPKYQLELIEFLSKATGDRVDQLFYTTHSPLMCYRTEFRALQARIDGAGISTIMKIAPTSDDIQKFKAAMKILEHYHPNVPTSRPAGKSTSRKTELSQGTPVSIQPDEDKKAKRPARKVTPKTGQVKKVPKKRS